jgi:hypothetical protein
VLGADDSDLGPAQGELVLVRSAEAATHATKGRGAALWLGDVALDPERAIGDGGRAELGQLVVLAMLALVVLDVVLEHGPARDRHVCARRDDAPHARVVKGPHAHAMLRLPVLAHADHAVRVRVIRLAVDVQPAAVYTELDPP